MMGLRGRFWQVVGLIIVMTAAAIAWIWVAAGTSTEALPLQMLFWPLHFFVWNPTGCTAVALLLLCAWWFGGRKMQRPHRTSTLVAACAWGGLAIYEYWMHKTGANIRVDLLLIGPVIYALTVIGLLPFFLRK